LAERGVSNFQKMQFRLKKKEVTKLKDRIAEKLIDIETMVNV
jgi:predicted oxidoreductase